MAVCKHHPEREATATCSRCGADLCPDCVSPGSEPPLCFDCSIATAREQVAREQVRGPAPAALGQPPRRRLSGLTKVILAAGAVILLAELAMIALPGRGASGTTAPPRLTPRQRAVAATGADLILVRQGLEAYRAAHGSYPRDLEAIAGTLPPGLGRELADPSTMYQMDDKGAFHLKFKGSGPETMELGSESRGPVLAGATP